MQILHLALNNLKIAFKDKMAAFWYLALPIIMTLIIGSSMSATDATQAIPVAVLDENKSFFSEYILEAIGADQQFDLRHVTLEEGKEMAENSDVAGFVHLLSESVTYFPSARQVSPLRLQKIIEKTLGELNNSARIAQGVITVFNPGNNLQDLTSEITGGFQESAIMINYRLAGTRLTLEDVPIGMNQSSPGMAVYFTLMAVVMTGANSILRDRQNGTLSRLLATPLNKGKIITGRTLGVFLVGITQISFLILIGQFLLGVNWGQDILATMLLSIAFVFSITGFSMALASLCKTPNQLGVLGNVVIIAMSMLGGAYWPVEMLSEQMKLIAKLVPTGWAISGYTDIILRGMSLGDIWLNIIILCIFGIVFLAFGIYKLKLE